LALAFGRDFFLPAFFFAAFFFALGFAAFLAFRFGFAGALIGSGRIGDEGCGIGDEGIEGNVGSIIPGPVQPVS
jgi:hypothetical protein